MLLLPSGTNCPGQRQRSPELLEEEGVEVFLHLGLLECLAEHHLVQGSAGGRAVEIVGGPGVQFRVIGRVTTPLDGPCRRAKSSTTTMGRLAVRSSTGVFVA